MAEEATAQAAALPPPAEAPPARSDPTDNETKEPAAVNGTAEIDSTEAEPAKQVATESVAPQSPAPEKEPERANDTQTKSTPLPDKPADTQEDIEMKDDIKPADAAPTADESANPPIEGSASVDKSKPRRKSSGGIPEHKKKLNKKASKAKMTHTDALPGDYFFVRLKGYPLWPAIVCDEAMLPTTLLKTRPVTAARADGTYRADYEDGGNKVKDRTFPVMYLHTNEFGWIVNTDLVDLDFETVGNVPTTMRKDLYAAHQLAAEQHDLDYFKEILTNFMEAHAAALKAKEEAKAAKKASKANKKSKTVETGGDGDEDVEMADVTADLESEGLDGAASGVDKPKKTKKRKAEEAATPQRSDSVKKPKTTIKLNTSTPKTTNGASTPQTAKDSSTKSAKSKAKKATPKVKEPEIETAKEPELSPEEKRVKKEKEILFLRHKLQKGLLTRDQEPKAEEMKQMSEFVTKLEGYAELEVAIIRATKINKVLKAILKLPVIPKEEEFNFKPRSQSLLDKWNKLLNSDQAPSATPATTAMNGVSEAPNPVSEEAATSEEPNGVKESSEETKVEEQTPVVDEAPAEVKDVEKVESVPAPSEEPAKESVAEPTPVESAA